VQAHSQQGWPVQFPGAVWLERTTSRLNTRAPQHTYMVVARLLMTVFAMTEMRTTYTHCAVPGMAGDI
jgi:hypothetical protein